MAPRSITVKENEICQEGIKGSESQQLLHLTPTSHPDRVNWTNQTLRESFIDEFIGSNGPPQIMLLCLILALGLGSTIGVVPAVMTDRYARLNHGYTGERMCSDYSMATKPHSCLDGSADAQASAAMEQMISNTLTFFSSSLIGSMSDEYGRKGFLVLGLMLSLFSPLCLVLIQIIPDMSPFWYYAAGSVSGLVNWAAVALSSLSDVMPPHWRAPCFGLLLAGFSLGLALAPQLALLLTHWQVSLLALWMVILGLGMIIFFFPETLRTDTATRAMIVRQELTRQCNGQSHRRKKWVWFFYRPFWELSILNRNHLFRLLSILAFFSGMVAAGDQTLLIYYVEERLDFDDKDIAVMFLTIGVLGIFVQAVVLKILNDSIGERYVVMLSFVLGFLQNVLYGSAKVKSTIFIAVAVGTFVRMAFPTISAIKANNVDDSEQGRIQGALYSVQALASASGPIFLRWIYGLTKGGRFLGPGSMFIVASWFYLVAVYCSYLLPTNQANSQQPSQSDHSTQQPRQENLGNSAETPLL